jgi:hypothetical protein
VARRTQGFIQVRAAKMHNTLRPASDDLLLGNSNELVSEEGPCRPYRGSGGRVTNCMGSSIVGHTRSYLIL